ncbi:MAG: glycosyltransferase [Planctomycetota bacterium]|nr:glycosyltransferase [Planctomycetota bacterium]
MTRLIVVDATPYGPEPSGTMRRAVELMRRLPALMPDDVFEMHWANDGATAPEDLVADNLVHARVDVSCRGGIWRWRARQKQLLRRHWHAPFTHLLVDYGPVIRPDSVKSIVTVHDLRFLHGYGGPARRMYGRLGYGRLLRRSAQVVAVSPSVSVELCSFYGLKNADIPRVVGNAPADVFTPPAEPVERSGALVVGRDEPRKARAAAVSAAEQAGFALEVVDDNHDDASLANAYRHAQWLLAPSLLEGYHMPVVEALACGTPVLASDIPPHRDLVEAGAKGICLVPRPTEENGTLIWPEAAARLREAPPTEIALPPGKSWDASAEAMAALIKATDPG